MPEISTPTAPTSTPSPIQAPIADLTTPHEPSQDQFMGDIADDFGDMDAGKPIRDRDETGKFKPSQKEKPAEAPPKPVEKLVEKPSEEEAQADKAPDKPAEAAKPTRMRELGQAYDDLKKKVNTEYEPTIQSLKSKIKELETKPPEDVAPVLAKLTALEKHNAELKQKLALKDFEEDPKYQEHVQSFTDQWNRTQEIFNQLEVTERVPDGVDDMGDPKFKEQSRSATPDDLLELARLPLGKMAKRTKELFGESSSLVLNQIVEIGKLWEAKERAKKEASSKIGEWQSQRNLEAQMRQKTISEAWANTNKDLEAKFPKAFKVESDNAEDQAAHTKGFAMADLLFLGNKSLTPEQIEALPGNFRDTVKSGKPLSEVQTVQLHALARIKIANHDRLVTRLKARDAKIAELEKSLKDYEKSEPAADRAGDGVASGDRDFFAQVEDDLQKLDRR